MQNKLVSLSGSLTNKIRDVAGGVSGSSQAAAPRTRPVIEVRDARPMVSGPVSAVPMAASPAPPSSSPLLPLSATVSEERRASTATEGSDAVGTADGEHDEDGPPPPPRAAPMPAPLPGMPGAVPAPDAILPDGTLRPLDIRGGVLPALHALPMTPRCKVLDVCQTR